MNSKKKTCKKFLSQKKKEKSKLKKKEKKNLVELKFNSS